MKPLATSLAAAVALGAASLMAADAPASEVVARVGSETITAADLEKLGGSRLFAKRTEEYTLRRQILDEAIYRRLVAKEAAARKLTDDELLKQEVDAKAPKSTPEERKAFYEQNKARAGGMAEAEALKQIESFLDQQKQRERRQAFFQELRAKADVKVLLEPPRIDVPVPADDPARGPAEAPVTIVEFSDFQCPFCSRVTPTLKKLEEAYGGKVRLVFRDFPLLQIHPLAAKAAEAGTCAHEQGKFWDMHDKLFADQAKLQVADLKKHAADLALDTAAFDQCLDSGKHAAEWQADMNDATALGVTSTPAFFINGRLVMGAQPYEAFAQVIDEELELAKAKAPAVEQAPKKGAAESDAPTR